MNQNGPPTIQPKRGPVEITKEVGGIEKESKKGPRGKSGEVAVAAKTAGVSRTTIRSWAREGVDINNSSDLIGRKRQQRSSAIPDDERRDAQLLASERGIGFYHARAILKLDPSKRERKKKLQTSKHHYSCPSNWNMWIQADYKRDLKSFPDWGSLWQKELISRHRKEKWAKLDPQTKRKKNSKKPADMNRRRMKLNAARRKRESESPHLRTANSLRSRLNRFAKGKHSSSIKQLLGCSMGEFKLHLQAQFKTGMSWDNYGTAWHIDHILPCSSFNHADRKQVEACWHWTNLRPMNAKDNIRKGARITNPQMSLLISFAA